MAAESDTVDAYFASFPAAVRSMLDDVRSAVHRANPDIEESVSYGMAEFSLDGRYLVYCAGWKKHISLHAVPNLSAGLETALASHRSGRGTIKFALNKPLPIELVEQIIAELTRQRAE